MENLKAKVKSKEKSIHAILINTPSNQIRLNTNRYNDFDNYGKSDDPETEWNNWVDWDQQKNDFDTDDD